MIRAVLFDLDETLILDTPVTERALRSAADLAVIEHPHLDPERLANDARESAQRLWGQSPYLDYCDRIGHSGPEALWAGYTGTAHPTIAALHDFAPGFRRHAWQQALRVQGVADPDPTLLEALAAHFFAARRCFPLYAEVQPLLAALQPRYKLGIVTNGIPDLQREKLAGCGVSERFQAAVVSGEIDCGKPDPGIFRHICLELGVAPAECVMVGDNPGRDVLGATNAGMKSVWVQRDGCPRDERYPADLDCTDLVAMLPWLQGLDEV